MFRMGSGLVFFFPMDIIFPPFVFPSDVHLIIVGIDFVSIACLLIININSLSACDCLFFSPLLPDNSNY